MRLLFMRCWMAVQIHRVWCVYSAVSIARFDVNVPFPVVYEYPLKPFVFLAKSSVSLVVYAEEAEVVQ